MDSTTKNYSPVQTSAISDSDAVVLLHHRHLRRFTLPFVSNESLDEADDQPTSASIPTPPFKTHDYVLSEEEIENERPFMRGRVKVPAKVLKKRPVFPIHVREILSDDEIENERPFMRGRVKVNKDVQAIKAHGHVYDVLSDEEWENERPFMHGRNPVSADAVRNRKYLQIQPVLSYAELENERPFMHGRNEIPKELEDRRHQRRLIELEGEHTKAPVTSPEETEFRRKLVRQKRFQQNKNGNCAHLFKVSV